ncbi:hypothetical protein FD754_019130 [Muntiacus muntjak]|uniref:Nuclear receptor coactivator 4 N-terminal domain-containing protein n=1 Tax=Muntiacus muntjak TaxID=9888 RepID=A0A5N3UZD1_MUNMU|nr:hypothetical protein FD754_019130 [Muntiacus muntjak]
MVHAGSSNIGFSFEKRASSTIAVPHSNSSRACNFFSNVWTNLKCLENWLHKSQKEEVFYYQFFIETEKVEYLGLLSQNEMDISECLVTPQESHNLEKSGNGSYETSENVNDWLVKPDSCANCQSNQPKCGETGNLGNLKCVNGHLEATTSMSTPNMMNIVRRKLCVKTSEQKSEPEKYYLNMRLCPSSKEATEQAKTFKTMVSCRIADSFQIIRNNPLLEWLITPSCKEGCPKEVPLTEDRAGKQSLQASWPLSGVPLVQLTGSCQESESCSIMPGSSAKEGLLNWYLLEEHNFPPDHYSPPAVCDYFAYMQLKVDKEKWLYHSQIGVIVACQIIVFMDLM